MSIADRNRIAELEAQVAALQRWRDELTAQIREMLAREPIPVQQAVRASMRRQHG